MAAVRGAQGLENASGVAQIVLHLLAIADGILLTAGFWTPITGALMGIFGVWYAVSRIEHVWSGILLASIGVSLALLGPGAWSVDARLFGWKRIDVRDHTKEK
jgi:putative oxidoreductase